MMIDAVVVVTDRRVPQSSNIMMRTYLSQFPKPSWFLLLITICHYTGGLPNITYQPRKPKPLGTLFKNGVEAMTGIVVNQDVVEGLVVQWEKKYVLQSSSLPKKEPNIAHVTEVLRQCEGA